MAAVPSAYEGLLTDRYATLIDPVAEVNTIRDLVKFVPGSQKSGKDYVFPIFMSDEQGITFDNSGDLVTLNAAISAQSKEARLSAPDIVMVANLPYSMMLRGGNGASLDGSQPAYFDFVDEKVKSMLRSAGNHVELSLIHGCGTGSTALDDVGVVASTPVVGGGTTYASATVQLTAASFIKDMWDNFQGAMFDVLNSAGTSIVAHNVKLVSIGDFRSCQIVVTCADATASQTVTSGHRFVPVGWFQGAAVGLNGQIKNTGTFANINATSWPKHKGNTFPVGGQLTRAKLFQASAQLPSTNQGGRRELVALVNSFTFADLAEETHSNTRWDIGGSAGNVESKEIGTTELQYVGPKATIRVISYDFQKQGQATMFDPSVAVRIGASDITMRGADGGDAITLHLQTQNGFQMRALSQQAPLLKQMNVNTLLTGIVNTGAFAPT